MTSGFNSSDLDYRGSHLPRGTFARSIFDNHVVRLSDRGGASQLIGDAWSDRAASELESWIGSYIPVPHPRAERIMVEAVHRLDTLPGVSMRASRIGLKNPDFVVFANRDGYPVIIGVDAKFSIETARRDQVSADAVRHLFERDVQLTALLPQHDSDSSYVDGVFLSPDYSLTHAMFRQQVGHRRLSVSPADVVLAEVIASDMFAAVASETIMDCLASIDGSHFPIWESLLAAQYYFRLERAVAGLVAEASKPLLGNADILTTEENLLDGIAERTPGAGGAWPLIIAWDRDVEHVRRQRQALHQVIGLPLSGAELRGLSDDLMDQLQVEPPPSRNRIRKALGARFTAEVVDRVGVILPQTAEFSGELERVAAAAQEVGLQYKANIRDIVGEVILQLAGAEGTERSSRIAQVGPECSA
jgi:hypothetical protein